MSPANQVFVRKFVNQMSALLTQINLNLGLDNQSSPLFPTAVEFMTGKSNCMPYFHADANYLSMS